MLNVLNCSFATRSITVTSMLIEFGLPSFNTLIFDSRVRLS